MSYFVEPISCAKAEAHAVRVAGVVVDVAVVVDIAEVVGVADVRRTEPPVPRGTPQPYLRHTTYDTVLIRGFRFNVVFSLKALFESRYQTQFG